MSVGSAKNKRMEVENRGDTVDSTMVIMGAVLLKE